MPVNQKSSEVKLVSSSFSCIGQDGKNQDAHILEVVDCTECNIFVYLHMFYIVSAVKDKPDEIHTIVLIVYVVKGDINDGT